MRFCHCRSLSSHLRNLADSWNPTDLWSEDDSSKDAYSQPDQVLFLHFHSPLGKRPITWTPSI